MTLLKLGFCALMAMVLFAACAPAPSPAERRVSKAIEAVGSPHRATPVKKQAFGDCDPRDLIHFTCE